MSERRCRIPEDAGITVRLTGARDASAARIEIVVPFRACATFTMHLVALASKQIDRVAFGDRRQAMRVYLAADSATTRDGVLRRNRESFEVHLTERVLDYVASVCAATGCESLPVDHAHVDLEVDDDTTGERIDVVVRFRAD